MKFDKNGDGFLNFEEFSASPLAQNAPSPEAAQKRFDMIDSDADGRLSKEELKAAMEKVRGSGDSSPTPGDTEPGDATSSQNNPAARLDTDGDNSVSFDEFKAGPGGQGDPDEVRRRFDRIDTNKDGELSFEEIRTFFQNQNRPAGPGRGGAAPSP